MFDTQNDYVVKSFTVGPKHIGKRQATRIPDDVDLFKLALMKSKRTRAQSERGYPLRSPGEEISRLTKFYKKKQWTLSATLSDSTLVFTDRGAVREAAESRTRVQRGIEVSWASGFLQLNLFGSLLTCLLSRCDFLYWPEATLLC